MALSSTTVWEVRTTGSDLNSGGFNPRGSSPGTDRSQQDAPHVVIDGSTITATVHTTTTQITLSGYTVTAADNRNLLKISGGTATAGVYEIIAVDSGNNRWTLDRSAGSSTQTVQGRMGGGRATFRSAFLDGVSGNGFWIRNGDGTVHLRDQNTGPNTSGGPSLFWMRGYGTVRGDGIRPTMRLSGTATSIVDRGDGINAKVLDINFDGASVANSYAFYFTNNQLGSFFYNCDFTDFTLRPLFLSGINAENCRFIRCGFGMTSGHFINCIFQDPLQVTGFNGVLVTCPIVYGCVFINVYGFICILQNTGQVRSLTCNNIIVTKAGQTLSAGIETYSNFTEDFGASAIIKDNLIIGGTVGINAGGNGNPYGLTVTNNAFFNCGTNYVNRSGTNGIIVESGSTNLTADPFVDAANGNFALNNTSGGGATLRALNFQLPSISTTRYPFGGWYLPGISYPLVGPGGSVF